MNAPEKLPAHAEFGLSGIAALRLCPGKKKAERDLPDESSIYAERGTLMHAVSETCLAAIQPTHVPFMPTRMVIEIHDKCVKAGLNEKESEIVRQYVEYVCDIECQHREIEVRVKPVRDPAYIDRVWGTADCVLFIGDTIHVIDLKTGQGVKVFADENEQLLGYGLGAVKEFDAIFGPFKKLVVHIVQPALDHYDVAEYPIERVMGFEGEIIQIIDAADAEDAPRVAGEKQCKFCRARYTCKTRANEMIKTAFEDFGETPAPEDLTIEEIGELLPRLGAVVDWVTDIKEFALKQAVDHGVTVPGHKLVEGRSNRKISDEVRAIDRLRAEGLDDYKIFVPQKLRGITDLEKELGKKRFSAVLDGLIEKPKGKPTLVPMDDKRPELEQVSSASADFS